MSKHVDGLTGKVFNSREEYLNHTSPVTGFKPTDPEHQGTRGLLISKEALRRKGKLTKARETAIDAQIEKVNSGNVDHKIMEAKRDRKGK